MLLSSTFVGGWVLGFDVFPSNLLDPNNEPLGTSNFQYLCLLFFQLQDSACVHFQPLLKVKKAQLVLVSSITYSPRPTTFSLIAG